MKGILIALILMTTVILSATSIYDIQFTTNPGRDNTYPSFFTGKIVTLEGIVTATGYKNGGFFVSEQSGGPWRGIYVKAETNGVKLGDKLVLKGTVDEFFGMTCIRDLSVMRVVNTNLPIPFANQVTTGQLMTPDQAEAYEGTLVKVRNATFLQGAGSDLNLKVNDGSGACLITSNLFSEKSRSYKNGDMFTAICGIACYCFGEYAINPRNMNDMAVMVPVFNQNRSWGRIKSIYR